MELIEILKVILSNVKLYCDGFIGNFQKKYFKTVISFHFHAITGKLSLHLHQFYR